MQTFIIIAIVLFVFMRMRGTSSAVLDELKGPAGVKWIDKTARSADAALEQILRLGQGTLQFGNTKDERVKEFAERWKPYFVAVVEHIQQLTQDEARLRTAKERTTEGATIRSEESMWAQEQFVLMLEDDAWGQEAAVLNIGLGTQPISKTIYIPILRKSFNELVRPLALALGLKDGSDLERG